MVDGPENARVVVFRHGPAETRDPARWPDDGLRPLSRKGTEQTRRTVRGLVDQVGTVTRLATSPAARARSTAEILGRALDPPRRPQLWPELDIGSGAAGLLARVRPELSVGTTVVLVGHDPTLSEFLGLALAGESIEFARLTKAGAACVEFPRSVRAGSARLLWLLTRKQLAGAGD
ncbi:MAG TPA: histidine phosphatase family protein [Thermoplasmata archaeon]|nr:histidine phosphatase family protein [Thermoplasmata archaeon]